MEVGSTSWEKLSHSKESHQEQTAKFAIAQEIDHKPGCNWCIKHMVKKRDRIVANIRKWQTRYLKRSHEFGIEPPKTVEQNSTLDAKNGNILIPNGTKAPIGHHFVQCHMISISKLRMSDVRPGLWHEAT